MQDGTSNYFKGLMLILSYLIVAASFFVHVDKANGESLMNPFLDQLSIGSFVCYNS